MTANSVIVMLKLDDNNENTFTSFSCTLLLDNCKLHCESSRFIEARSAKCCKCCSIAARHEMLAHVSTCATAKQIPDYENGDDGPECTMARLTYSLYARASTAYQPGMLDTKLPVSSVPMWTTVFLLRLHNTARKCFWCLWVKCCCAKRVVKHLWGIWYYVS